jgi:hypothetical protein
VARFLELNKKKAELEFQRDILGIKTDAEFTNVTSNAAELAVKIRATGMDLVFPNQKNLNELTGALQKFPPEAIRGGLKIRDGLAYQTLKDRGAIIKKNYENRLEIAKLLILLAKMQEKERENVKNAISVGAVESAISIGSLSEQERKKLAKFMRHCGVECVVSDTALVPPTEDGAQEKEEKEMRVDIANKTVWITEKARVKLDETMGRMKEINAKIQLQNAVRQIKQFDQKEEDEFVALQKQYLELMNERDLLLKEANEEESLSVTIR